MLKIYYFFSYGEIVDCFESDSIEKAKKQVTENGYSLKEIDCIVEYDKKFGTYQTNNKYSKNKKR